MSELLVAEMQEVLILDATGINLMMLLGLVYLGRRTNFVAHMFGHFDTRPIVALVAVLTLSSCVQDSCVTAYRHSVANFAIERASITQVEIARIEATARSGGMIFREARDPNFVGGDLKSRYAFHSFDVCNANIYIGIDNSVREQSFNVTISVSDPRYALEARRIYNSLGLR